MSAFRARAAREGKGYQTLINEALRRIIDPNKDSITLESFRQVLREELRTMEGNA